MHGSKWLLPLMFAIVACGSEGGGGGDAALAGDKVEKKAASEAPSASPEAAGPKSETPAAPSDGANQYHSMAVVDGAALPACVPAAEGWLVYVKSDSKFKTCASGAWADIDIKGAKGDAGVAGKDGTNGTDNRIIKTIGCNGQLASTGIFVSYHAALMSSDDLFANASVGGAAFDVSNSAFYSSEQNGALTGSVLMTMDAVGADNYGWWNITLDRSTLIVSATYHDADQTSPVQTWSMTPDKCVVNDFR